MRMQERKASGDRSAIRRSPQGSSENRSGASQSKTKISHRLKSYWAHHRQVAKDSLLRLLKTPLQSLLTWLVVAIAIALPGMLYIALNQFQSVGENWQAKPQLSVFIHYRAREAAVISLREKLLTKPEIADVEYISPEKALIEFEQFSGLGNVLKTLDDNPLPAVLTIKPADQYSDPDTLEKLIDELAQEQLIDDVRIDMEWVKRLNLFMTVAERIVLALAGMLTLGVILVIGNTIRMAIENRREEIIVVKLVGATNAFVRRPFLYTGFWYGFCGGVIAWLLLTLGVLWLSDPINALAGLYQSDMTLKGLSFLETLVVIIGAGIIGLFGAMIAVAKHLHTIEPR